MDPEPAPSRMHGLPTPVGDDQHTAIDRPTHPSRRRDRRFRAHKRQWLLPSTPFSRRIIGAVVYSRSGTANRRVTYRAASLSFLSARALMRTVAGLAANTCSCLVNGLMPLRLGLAGIFCTSILSRPGSVKD